MISDLARCLVAARSATCAAAMLSLTGILFGAIGPNPAYERALEIRVDKIVRALELGAPQKSARVHDALVAHYHALNNWQAAYDLKSLGKSARSRDGSIASAARRKLDAAESARRGIHDALLRRLSADLTAAQIETVEDKMTYDKVRVTYEAYCRIVPGLSDADKARILACLKQARDKAIVGVSAKEKSEIFNKYKGKINNYLSHAGHDVGAAYKAWGERQRAGNAGK